MSIIKKLQKQDEEYNKLMENIHLEQNDEPKCCDDDNNLEWVEEGECFPYEVWKCLKCKKMYNVEMVRDFKNKEVR
tara:strand:- start:225 stop:452 length:228 start_codon:yes stop_codon:yes gene_type:complete